MYSVTSTFRRLRNWLILLCTGDSEVESLDEERYRQRILVMTSCFWLLIVICLTVITPLLIDLTPEGQTAADILFVITSAAVVFSMTLLRLFQNRIMAANVMLMIYVGAFAGACMFFGGSSSPTFPIMMMAPAMAGIVGSVAMSISWGIIVLAFWTGVLMLERTGYVFTQIIVPENHSLAMTLAFAGMSISIVAVIIIYAEMNKVLRSILLETNEELEHMSSHDQLTRLPNRRFYDERMGNALHRAAKQDAMVGLLMLDLNDFKQINDTHGHGVGDKILITVAQRIHANLRDTDLVARLGGDEFVAVLEDVTSADEVLRIANKLSQAIEQPITVRQRQIEISASIGITMFPTDGRQKHELEEKADKAMYHAKKRGIPVALSSLESARLPTPVRRLNPDHSA